MIFCEFCGPPCLVLVKILLGYEPGQVFVIRPNVKFFSDDVMLPLRKGTYDCEHLLIVGLVVPLYPIEGL